MYSHRRQQRSSRLLTSVTPAASVAGFSPGRPCPACAAFVGKLSVNTTYVTGAPNATESRSGRRPRRRHREDRTDRGASDQRHLRGGGLSIWGTLDTASEKACSASSPIPTWPRTDIIFTFPTDRPMTSTVCTAPSWRRRPNLHRRSGSVIAASARGSPAGRARQSRRRGLIVHAGKLYVGVGDTGQNATPPVNKYGSCLNKGNGKILRVNLDGTVPTDNPLVGLGAVSACDTALGPWTTAPPDSRIFAWGLRNPWRFWVDARTTLMWIGDVGEITQEEISVGSADRHYGYPFVEGSMVWGDVQGMNCATLTPSRICTGPVYSYPHSQGQAVTGGLIPEGCGWTGVFGSPPMSSRLRGQLDPSVAVNAGRTGSRRRRRSTSPPSRARRSRSAWARRALYVVYTAGGNRPPLRPDGPVRPRLWHRLLAVPWRHHVVDGPAGRHACGSGRVAGEANPPATTVELASHSQSSAPSSGTGHRTISVVM